MNIEMTDLDMILNYLETTNLEPHDDYTSEITYKDQKILYKYIKELQQENNELKKQLHEASLQIQELSYEDLLNQQQEFIKYLEDEIKACKAVSDLLFNSNKEIKVYKEILTKYKEIIGGNKDE